jgi:hypothetical protein
MNIRADRMFQMTEQDSLAWLDLIFQAKAAGRGGIVRRAVKDIDREVGRDRFIAEVRRRRFHLVECGGQFIVICNSGHMRVIC